MDVRFYPAPPANVGSCSLPADPSCLSSLEYYHSNKARYSVGERGVRLHSAPTPGISPARKRLPTTVFDGDNMYMNDNNQEFRSPNQISNDKRSSAEMMKPKPKPQKKKKKKDPNEPQKPVSAYALFFRDTQAAIKGQNPNATFGDVSKIVASMWDSLGEEQKQGYKRKTEAAKKEYLKALAAYRASLVSKTYNDPEPKSAQQTSQPSHLLPPKQPLYSPQPSSPYLGPSGSFPLSDLQSYAGPPRHSLASTLSQSQMLPPSMSASPPAPFQISPPLHPHAQLSLHQSSLLNQPIRMQQSQPIISHQMGLQAPLHSPPLSQQGFSHIQAEYQNSVGGSQSPGAPNPVHGQNPDWDSEYCNRDCGPNACSSGMGARDKPLYLT
ncbi:TOX high mobility group box family member 2-like isoform X4 [Phyllopteryx taeniolatus]|uniref:TOX high mobility group box family member 2-like isoform X4 n=1 Tax=Phyllopteryx taeniolatus TaxID=161469 RepID=UPI002AD34029|nr:TOX high mobility group box family member 2-like isoform X4 [Phyllopteryx taeniolatus]